MEWNEIKTKSTAELHRLLAQSRNHLRELRFKDAAKQLKTVREIRIAKKTVAKILTKLNGEKSQASDTKQQ